MEDDLSVLVARCRDALGTPASWRQPDGYPDSLGLCVLDAVWSIGVRYSGVVNVVARYRAMRRDAGGDPDRDGVADVLDLAASVGDPASLAAALDNMQRTSTTNGILKADAVVRACQALVDAGILTTQQLRDAGRTDLEHAKKRWLAVPGQRSGVSWRYLLLLAGRQDVKPDRMLVGFVADALGRSVAPAEAADLVMRAAARLDVEPRLLDHAIWRHRSGRPVHEDRDV